MGGLDPRQVVSAVRGVMTIVRGTKNKRRFWKLRVHLDLVETISRGEMEGLWALRQIVSFVSKRATWPGRFSVTWSRTDDEVVVSFFESPAARAARRPVADYGLVPAQRQR